MKSESKNVLSNVRKKRALAEQKRQEKAQKAEEERLAQLTVDQETGEILDDPDDNEVSLFDNIPDETPAVEPEILAYEHVPEGLKEASSEENLEPEVTPAEQEMTNQEDDGEPLEVDFTAKANLLYKLPTIDLFAPDKPKNQSKKKISFVEISKSWRIPLIVLVLMSRLNELKSVRQLQNTKSSQPLVCVLTAFQTWLMI